MEHHVGIHDDIPDTSTVTRKQRLFVRYLTAILIDLAILNLFDEYWDWVIIDSFTISLFAAVVLQVLLKATIHLEHVTADYFKAREGASAKVLRLLGTWLVLFGSKFVILIALDFAFGERVLFLGPLHGLVSLITVLVVMLVVEEILVRISHSIGLAGRDD